MAVGLNSGQACRDYLRRRPASMSNGVSQERCTLLGIMPAQKVPCDSSWWRVAPLGYQATHEAMHVLSGKRSLTQCQWQCLGESILQTMRNRYQEFVLQRVYDSDPDVHDVSRRSLAGALSWSGRAGTATAPALT